ncbi:MAG: hypothetical protein RIB59_02015, partial [Rhodospirillales bacterium]
MSPSAQKSLVSGAVIAALISLGLIGYKLLPVLIAGTEPGVAHSQPLPLGPARPAAPEPKASKETTEAPKAAMTPAEAAVIEKEKETETASKTDGEKKPAEAEKAESKQAEAGKTKSEKAPEESGAPDKFVEAVPWHAALPVLPELAALPDKHPVRPYEETLPDDIYEPPAIKVPSREPKPPPKARRIRKDAVKEPVRGKRLTPIARSQLPPW